MINELINNLNSLGYDTYYFENRNEAIAYLNSTIHNTTVGIGGSVTVKELDLFNILNTHNEVYWHMLETDRTKSREIINKAKDARIYISSVNATEHQTEWLLSLMAMMMFTSLSVRTKLPQTCMKQSIEPRM